MPDGGVLVRRHEPGEDRRAGARDANGAEMRKVIAALKARRRPGEGRSRRRRSRCRRVTPRTARSIVGYTRLEHRRRRDQGHRPRRRDRSTPRSTQARTRSYGPSLHRRRPGVALPAGARKPRRARPREGAAARGAPGCTSARAGALDRGERRRAPSRSPRRRPPTSTPIEAGTQSIRRPSRSEFASAARAASRGRRGASRRTREGVGALLGDLDGARADDDAVGELGGRGRVLGRRDAEAGVERHVRDAPRALDEAGELGRDARPAAPVVPVTVTR